MKMPLLLAAVLTVALLNAWPAVADSNSEVHYAPPDSWIQPPPPATASPPNQQPVSVVYDETQLRVTASGTDSYHAFRARIDKPEGLALGNLWVVWDPDLGGVTVHAVQILRGGQTIDVLDQVKFKVIQRETGLEQAVLTGSLTAMVQVPNLQLGDELVFSATTHSNDPVLAGHLFNIFQFPTQEVAGSFRISLTWPQSMALHWQVSRDLPPPVPVSSDGDNHMVIALRDPVAVIVNEHAPARFNIRRLFEYSDFSSWRDVSKLFAPLFVESAQLTPESPLHDEIARIAAASPNPVERAQLALQLVQQQIRYVYIGLNGGNFRPASADTTWTRRFGDCKAKTALLLALLQGLGIEAEAVLVNPLNDDGLTDRLPNPGLFSHVLVRATIGGQRYWLDGTRTGDHWLDMVPPPRFHWALPVRSEGAELEAVVATLPADPQLIENVSLDTRAGAKRPAIVNIQTILQGDEAYQFYEQLASRSAVDSRMFLQTYWRQTEDWVAIDDVSWTWDDRTRRLSVTLTGSGQPDWSGSEKDGFQLSIPGAGFYPPDLLRRPREQDALAPWLTDFPLFKCWVTTIHLPKPRPNWHWHLSATAMNQEIGATRYWRKAAMKDGIVRTVMSRQVVRPEISASEAAAENHSIASFDNSSSTVFETRERKQAPRAGGDTESVMPFAADTDWTKQSSLCAANPPPKPAGPDQ